MSTPDVVIHTATRPGGGPGRYGLVVSRKVGGAVVRNRLRRQARAAVALAGGIRAGIDAVIVVKPGASLKVTELARSIWQIMEEWSPPSEGLTAGGR